MLEILKYPNTRLREISKPVEAFDSDLHEYLDELAKAMYSQNGIGLAAPQVGTLNRLFVIDVTPQLEEGDPNRKRYEFINPVLSDGAGKTAIEEACLSVPGIVEKVSRKEEISIQYQDRNGKQRQLRASGILSVAIQHENDHLDGILFIDRLSPLKRKLVKRRLKRDLQL